MKFICQKCGQPFIFDEESDSFEHDYTITLNNIKKIERMTLIKCLHCGHNNILNCKILGGVN